MPFTKVTTSQHSHYDAVACVVWKNRTATETTPPPSQNQSQPQRSNNKPFGICVVGESATELLEFNTQRWWPLPHCNGDGSSTACAVASVGSHIYQVGGLRGIPNHEVTTACHALEFGATEWKALPGMKHARCYAAAIGIGNSLYVVGGRGRRTSTSSDDSSSSFFTQLNSVEVFDCTTQTWTTKAPMSTPRMAPAIVALNETTIAIIGGYSDRGEWETSIEYYDIPTNTWTSQGTNIPPMSAPVAFPKAVTIRSQDQTTMVERILVVGTSILRPTSSQDTYTTIFSFPCSNRPPASNKWIKLVNSNPKHRSKLVLPNEGCAIALDSDSNTLYSVGGRVMKTSHTGSSAGSTSRSSKQVLAWKIPRDDTALVKDLQVPTFALPLLGLGGGDHTMPFSSTDAGYPSTVVRKQRQSLAVRKGGSSRASIPFSTSEVDEYVTSYQGLAGDEGGGSPLVVSPLSTSRRQRHHEPHTPKIISLGSGSSSSNDDEEENDPVDTVHVTNMEWTDRMGMVGRYTGTVQGTLSPLPLAPHGKGTFLSNITGDTFEGEWKNGKRHGQGRWTFNMTGDVFEGLFVKDRKNGRGNYQWRDGRCFEGNYENDQAEDLNGTLTWKDGTLYEGAFRNGQRTGKGTIHFPSRNVKYVGEFRNGKYDGYGTCTFEDSKVYSGSWRKGKAHGRGKLAEADGTVVHDGEWEDDAPILHGYSS